MGLLTSTVAPSAAGPQASSYEATTVILDSGGGTGQLGFSQSGNLKAMAALALIGEVPIRVTEKLGLTDDPALVARGIDARAETESGIIKMKATSRDPKRAEALADGFARELLIFLEERKDSAIRDRTEDLLARMTKIKNDISKIDARFGRLSRDEREFVRAERDAKVRQYGLLYESYVRLSDAATTTSGLQIVEEASALPVATIGFQPPRTRKSRLILGGILGLLAGVGIALVTERIDTRLRTRQETETRFGMPVLAEIPFVPRWRRRRLLTPTSSRMSVYSDSFRLLASNLSAGNGTQGNGKQRSVGPRRTILITSPGLSEGKSTIAANLAATYAEVGRSVLLISCDFRRPTVHRAFGLANDEGLADALVSANGAGVLEGHILSTTIPLVSVVPSGPPPQHPGELLSSDGMRRAIAEARARADIVILDSAPLLTSDAAHLVSEVDAVLVVAQAGKTQGELAERAGELLRLLQAPVAGVALNAASNAALPRGYYHSEHGRRRWGFSRMVRQSKDA